MADVIISPNMNLPIPVVGVDPGPDWANNVDACLEAIDSHDHSPGKGVQITPDGININADLPMGGFNLTESNAVMFNSLSAALTSLLRSLQVVGVDLYYIDGSGNTVRITQSGSVTGSSGTITGLPSGTASASFSGGTFLFRRATNTPATFDIGPVIIRSSTAGSKGVTLSAQAAQTADYNVFWPLVAPAANQFPISDASGNLSWTYGQLPLGSVIATFPNLTGAYASSGTTAADAYGFVRCIGQTISDGTSPMNGQVVPNINNSVFLQGSTTAGSAGGSATASGVGAHTHTFTSSTSVATSAHTHNFSHVHKWCFITNVGTEYIWGLQSTDVASTTIDTSNINFFRRGTTVQVGGGNAYMFPQSLPVGEHGFTTGVLSPASGSGASANTAAPSATTTVSGTTDSAGSSFSILPPFISTVYLMRIK